MAKVTLSPVTRISGLLSIDVFLDSKGIVKEADCIGEQFRGFELMLKGRHITDAVYFTQRICGICSMAHGYTAARLAGQIYGLELTPEAILLQQAMLGAEFLQNHIRHLYLLALPDYLNPESTPGYTSPREPRRFSQSQQRLLHEHYFAAMDYSAKCHEMLAVFGGKIPHQHGLVSEGVAVAPTAETSLQFLSLLRQVREFIEVSMLPDFYLLAEVYPDYWEIGTRPARFLSFGLFDPALGGHFPPSIADGDKFYPVNVEEISESVYYSWYQNSPEKTAPDPEKVRGYTWVKAPRYRGMALEGGPLARKIIRSRLDSSSFKTGAMARLVARAEEAALIAVWMEQWMQNLPEHGQYIIPLKTPIRQKAFQYNDAPRGALLHSMSIKEERIESYNVITPSTWNFSPKDEWGQNGPVEEALIGTKIKNTTDPVEIGRIVRAFDPCLSCAPHLIDPNGRRIRV
ncbi:MAG: nickel-dependent hydrogenase large subunit, partial [Bacillota bacterium]